MNSARHVCAAAFVASTVSGCGAPFESGAQNVEPLSLGETAAALGAPETNTMLRMRAQAARIENIRSRYVETDVFVDLYSGESFESATKPEGVAIVFSYLPPPATKKNIPALKAKKEACELGSPVINGGPPATPVSAGRVEVRGTDVPVVLNPMAEPGPFGLYDFLQFEQHLWAPRRPPVP